MGLRGQSAQLSITQGFGTDVEVALCGAAVPPNLPSCPAVDYFGV